MLEQLQESCLSHIFDKWEKEKGVTENGVRSKSMVWKRGLPLESENVKAPHAQTTTWNSHISVDSSLLKYLNIQLIPMKWRWELIFEIVAPRG